MSTQDLRAHPIFTSRNMPEMSLDLSLNNLQSFKESRRTSVTLERSVRNAAGRRRIMALRESDLLLAVGNEIRITSLSDAYTLNGQQRSYKVCRVPSTLQPILTRLQTLYTPNIEFEIRQIAVNQNGKLLAVIGSHQVAVISLPRAGYSKLVTSRVDCR